MIIRLHYLMVKTVETKTIELFKKIANRALKPVPLLTVSQWADRYRVLSSDSGAEVGRWKTSRAPYQREIMDSFTQDGIWKVIVKSASQIGKSDIMNNVIGRFACLDPAPILMIQPTITMAEDYSKSRIAPMIKATSILGDIFREPKSRESNNTILSKLFPGGRLVMGGANSPAGLASRPVRIVLADEVDRFPESAGTEGDPLDLAIKRTSTFWNKCIGIFSTPTIQGESRIEDAYLEGTQEEWQHRCPNCGEWHLVNNRNIHSDYETKIDKKGNKHVLVKDVVWRCPDCGFAFDELAMKQAEQKYVIQNASALEKGVRSFFVNCFASPWLSWVDIMQEWLEAKGAPEREKVATNTLFGETYERKGQFSDTAPFLARREQYGAELPDGVLFLTAAVDTQDNRLEYEVEGWGEGEECWGIKKGVILGVPDDIRVWGELDMQLDREYHFLNGGGLLIARTFIDSGGHYADAVYDYCYRNMAKQRFAIKGASTPGVPLIHKYVKVPLFSNRNKRKSTKRTKTAKTIPLVLLGTDSGKQYIMDRLAIETPGSKFYHFPLDRADDNPVAETLWNRGYDDIYFKGLIAEQRVPHKKDGRLVYTWENVAKDHRNEPLDLRVYNLACLQSSSPDFALLKQLVNNSKAELLDLQKINGRKSKKRNFGSVRHRIKEV